MLGNFQSPNHTRKSANKIASFLKGIVEVRDDEVDTLLKGFAGLFCVLGSYFLLLPIRDEAGVSLGTKQLPFLFVGSFVLTVIVTPLVSQFLVRPGVTPDKAVHQLYRLLALSLLGFYIAYQATPTHAEPHSHGQQERAFNKSATFHRADQHSSHAQHRAMLVAHPSSTAALNTSSGHKYPPMTLVGPHESRATALPGRSLQERSVRSGDSSLSTAQRFVRVAFFLWVSVVNLVGLSTMWARMADVFGSEAGTRLFGFLGAGATCGQLVGSLLATAWASALRSRGSSGQIAAPMLVSAAALEIAGRIASRLRRLSPVLPSPSKSRSPLGQSRQGQGLGAQLWHSFARLWEGFQHIAASAYLAHLSAYTVFTTVIASLMYFEKSMVVASAAGDAASRMALFGSINSASAFVIAVLQLAATGRLLKRLGLATALTVSPAFAAALMLGIAVSPTPLVVAAGEVLRKVVGYALARPAREVLFTVVPREEMYKAKICIDTLVVRGGDMLAAGLFHFLDSQYHLGPSGCAAAAFPICLGCCALAYTLGRKQEWLARPQHM